jgi:hypothetical protein
MRLDWTVGLIESEKNVMIDERVESKTNEESVMF